MKFLILIIFFSFAADLSFANMEEVENLMSSHDEISCVDYDNSHDSEQASDTHCHCHDSHVHVALIIDLIHSSFSLTAPMFKNYMVFEHGNASDYFTEINRPPIA